MKKRSSIKSDEVQDAPIKGGFVPRNTLVEANDKVFNPAYYTQWPIEPFTFLMLNDVPFAEASVIKYMMRWRKKDGIQDLHKAARIIEMIIELETNKSDYTAKKTSL